MNINNNDNFQCIDDECIASKLKELNSQHSFNQMYLKKTSFWAIDLGTFLLLPGKLMEI